MADASPPAATPSSPGTSTATPAPAFGVVVPNPGTAAPHVPFSFQAFMERMKDRRAADIVQDLTSFQNVIWQNYDSNNKVDTHKLSEAVQRFVVEMEHKIASHALFQDSSPAERDNTIEGLEKYLMTKIYDLAFAPTGDPGQERDEELTRRIASLGFLQPSHLDIAERYTDEPMFEMAQKELLKVNAYKAPRDKLTCIANCCKVLMKLLNVTQSASGADEFIPLLIFAVLKSNPPKLHSNLQYITLFRNPSKLIGETAYFFTNINSCVQFIEGVTPDALSITPEEFESGAVSDMACAASTTLPPTPSDAPSYDACAHALASLNVHAPGAADVWRSVLRFRAVDAASLHVQDVAILLEATKRLIDYTDGLHGAVCRVVGAVRDGAGLSEVDAGHAAGNDDAAF